MPTGKPTNLSWIQQLDELVPPTGSFFDKTVAWEKLQVKLESKQLPKKRLWVWWAAASVILLIGILGSLNIYETPKTKLTTGFKNGDKSIPALSAEKDLFVLPLEKKLADPVISDNQSEHKSRVEILVTGKKKINDIKKSELESPFLATKNQQVNISDTGSVKKENAMAVQPGIYKNKLAVVHNNELARQDMVEILPAGSNSGGVIPDFRKIVLENTIKTEDIDEPSVKHKKRLLPFGNSNKPKD